MTFSLFKLKLKIVHFFKKASKISHLGQKFPIVEVLTFLSKTALNFPNYSLESNKMTVLGVWGKFKKLLFFTKIDPIWPFLT